MKGFVFILLLSTVVALSAFAQQANSNSAAQPPLQGGDTTCKDSMQPPGGADFWNGSDPNMVNLLGHGITTKKDVQKVTQPIQTCLDRLSDTAASHTKMVRDMDTHTQQGVQLASTKTEEADRRTLDATNKATAAQQAATQATTRVTVVEQGASNVGHYEGGAQTEIHFRPGQTVLSKASKNALDQMADSLKGQHGYVIEVRGYSSGSGHTAIANSKRMANSVVRYLTLTHQVPLYRISVLGMGNAPAEKGAKKRTSGGLVEVNLLKNTLVSSTSP